MQCECCQAEIPEGKVRCPQCKTPVTQTIQGFEFTKAIQKQMRALIEEQHERIANTEQLVGMVGDYLPEWEKECELIRKMIQGGVLDIMLTEEDKKEGVSKARDTMLNKKHLAENEAEFVLVVFAYMLKLPYMSKLAVKEKKKEEKVKKKDKDTVVTMDTKPFKKFDAFKYRISKHVVIKEGFTKLDGYCFDGFGMMRTVKLPESMMCIGEYAFTDCKHLTDIEISPAVRKIEKGAFNACVSLKNVNIPEGVLELDDNTFFCCTDIEKIVIPNSVSGFGENCFSGCDSLRMLVVPQSVKFIDTNCFAYCPNLVIYCYENSYVHKYCMQNKIKFKTWPLGTQLPTELEGGNKEEKTK
ncbi:MAG: leucine-rich repeat domain-containing protein [Ruminococcus sp.]|nr:leucine-rich repeat domain-containing protein [Ruminococcus sp.]